MANPVLFSIAAAVALIPAGLSAFRRGAERDAQFWLLLAVAAAGPLAWVAAQTSDGWQTGFAGALWLTVAGSVLVFILLAATADNAWRLAPLLLPYLLILAVSATVWSQASTRPLLSQAPPAWVILHIVASIATYALLTLAAIAGAAVLLQEGALRRKRRGRLVELLPSVADAESLELRLLALAEWVLGVGVASGMALQFFATGELLTFNHKTIFIVVAFVLIAILLIAHHRSGLRGRRAARVVLVVYLLVTLGYPGVKFVTDVMLG